MESIMRSGPKVPIADKETLDRVYELVKEDDVFGFIEHMDILDPEQRIEYIGANKNYKPFSRNHTTGAMDLGSWAEFPWLVQNRPYMVHSDGTADYELDSEDYTKKLDGSASDVSNTAYDGGAFAWVPKIYKHERMDGDDRVVLFSFHKKDGYLSNGFTHITIGEVEGVWIPMFYGSIVGDKLTGKAKSISGTQPVIGLTCSEQLDCISRYNSRYGAFFGGAVVETLIDLMIMFSKTSSLQEAFGYGNCNGNKNMEPYFGVKPNAVVGGGQFYGTDDKKSLNKIFHSIVLGSYQQYQRDPYEVVANGAVKVSKDYTYDLTGATYEDTGISVDDGSDLLNFPDLFRTVSGYGSVPIKPYKGSSDTGSCDGLYLDALQSTLTSVCLRFGDNKCDTISGPNMRNWRALSTSADWDIGFSLMTLPPVGYSP